MVDLKDEGRAGIFPGEPQVMVLAKSEVFLGIDDLLSFEAEIEDDPQVTGVGDHYRQIFAGYVRRETEQEAMWICRCEANSDFFGDC